MTVRDPEPVDLGRPVCLNKLCELEDWRDPRRVAVIRRILPYLAAPAPDFPSGMEHRKHWGFASCCAGWKSSGRCAATAWCSPSAPATGARLRADQPGALGVRHRHLRRRPVPRPRGRRRDAGDPDRFARIPYRRDRLVVQWMDGLDLRHEDATFDAAFSLSSIEHFGGLPAARRGLGEMARVVRPGGLARSRTSAWSTVSPATGAAASPSSPPRRSTSWPMAARTSRRWSPSTSVSARRRALGQAALRRAAGGTAGRHRLPGHRPRAPASPVHLGLPLSPQARSRHC